jgi:hypothetical protein
MVGCKCGKMAYMLFYYIQVIGAISEYVAISVIDCVIYPPGLDHPAAMGKEGNYHESIVYVDPGIFGFIRSRPGYFQ